MVSYAAEVKSGFSAKFGSCVRHGMVCGKKEGSGLSGPWVVSSRKECASFVAREC